MLKSIWYGNILKSTHWALNKMAIFADDIFKWSQFAFRLVRWGGLIDNKSLLVVVKAWRRTGDKPLPEPMLRRNIEAMWCQ